jgi:hypothetical protein
MDEIRDIGAVRLRARGGGFNGFALPFMLWPGIREWRDAEKRRDLCQRGAVVGPEIIGAEEQHLGSRKRRQDAPNLHAI